MDSFRRALQTNEKLFFRMCFNYLPKTEKIFERIASREY